MWARDLEVALAAWLAASPFVFRHPPGATGLWWNDLACAALVALLALASYWPPARRAHWGELAVAAWLVGFGWVATRDGLAPASQNHVLVGLLLGMLAIVPSRAAQPPAAWSASGEEASRAS